MICVVQKYHIHIFHERRFIIYVLVYQYRLALTLQYGQSV